MKKEMCRGRRPRRPAKRIISILLSLIMLSSITASLDFSAYALASSGSCGGNVKWSFNSTTGTLTISGTGDIPDNFASPFRGQTVIKRIIIQNGVTNTGYEAFRNCTSLLNVTIPNSVTTISVDSFKSCTALQSITIPNSVKVIARGSFYNCTSLSSITIPNSVTSIGAYPVEGAFYACSGLTSISVESGNKVYDSRNNCNAIIKSSTNELISGCKNTIIPDSVTSIGTYAFYGSTGLTNIIIPDSVTSIGQYAFQKCTGLSSIIIPNSVTNIETYAFAECTGLTSITIPNSITIIGQSIFYRCTCLQSILIPDSITSIPAHMFNNCTGLVSITIPNSVKSIGIYAFVGCTSLTNVYYSDSESAWNKITIDETGNDCLKKSTIHFNYTANAGTEACVSHIWNSGIFEISPTCINSGSKKYTCTVCGATKTESVPATGVHTYDRGTVTTEPTCSRTGVITYKCTGCSASYTEPIVPLAHNYVAKVTRAATCNNNGIRTYTCSGCGASYTETIAALGHNYTAKVTKAATCNNNGIRTYTCSRCGARYTQTIKALGHNYVRKIKKATPKESGYSDTVCSRCGDEHYKYIGSPYAELSSTTYIYNGKAKKPKVTVYNDYGQKLSSDFYKVIYPKGRKKIGKYTVKIVLKGAYYSGTIKKSFEIVKKVKKPAQVKGLTFKRVVNHSNFTGTDTAKWKKVKGASGYQIKLGDKEGSSKIYWYKTVNKKGASNTTYNYYPTYGTDEGYDHIKVRAYKVVNGKKVYGKWSKVVRLKL